MTLNLKIITAVIIIVVIAAIAFAYYQFGMQKAQPAPENVSVGGNIEEQQKQQAVLAPATGNVDDAVNALISSSNNEQSALSIEEGDTSLINIDSQAIDEFGQSYNEEF